MIEGQAEQENFVHLYFRRITNKRRRGILRKGFHQIGQLREVHVGRREHRDKTIIRLKALVLIGAVVLVIDVEMIEKELD